MTLDTTNPHGSSAEFVGEQVFPTSSKTSRARVERQRRRLADAWSTIAHDGRAELAIAGATAGSAALGAAALFVQQRTRQAEAENPPEGGFVEVDGVRLHYIERGRGEPLVLLHGNGAFFQEMMLSSLVDIASRRYRVFVFDRPGYGYSERPRWRSWTPEKQARLFAHAFAELGIRKPIVLGHSWGAMVAVAMGLNHPRAVKSLVLLSGYYFPTARVDVAFASQPAIPIVGDILRHTIAPLVARVTWRGVLRKLFGPNPVPDRFEEFPVWMASRPGQIRAAAEEAAMMIPAAERLSQRYGELRVPALIMSGGADRMVEPKRQSVRLHDEVPRSALWIVGGVGHMIHHIEPFRVSEAIDQAAAMSSGPLTRRASGRRSRQR